MERATLNLSEAISFDLSAGRVNLREAYPQLLVPTQGFKQLCEAAGEEATRAFGELLGKQMAERMTKRLSETDAKLEAVSPDEFLKHLRAEFAIAGLGSLSLEKWGKALLLVLDHGEAPLLVASSSLESCISKATGRAVRAVHLMQDGPRDRFLLASADTAEQVAKWLSQDVSWGEVLVRLHTTAQ